MSYVLASGCSHTEGYELEQEIGIDIFTPLPDEKYAEAIQYRNQKSWTAVVARKLKLGHINISTTGASNELIIWNTVEFLQDTKLKPKLVLIGLSGPARRLLYFKDEPINYNPAHYSEHIKNVFREQGKDFKKLDNWNYCSSTYFYSDKYNDRVLKHMLIYLDSYCRVNNIKYFVVPTLEIDIDITKYCSSISTVMELYNEQFDFPRTEGHHWLSEGHQAWGEYVYEQIKNKNVLD